MLLSIRGARRASQLQLTVYQWHPRPVGTTRADAREVAIQKFRTPYLQAFFDNLRGKLIHAVIDRALKDMLGGATLVMRSAVLANVLDTPVAKLTVGEVIDLGYDFFNCGSLLVVNISFTNVILVPMCPRALPCAGPEGRVSYLFFLHAILKYVLHNQTTGLAQSNFVPHPTQGFVDFSHDLWRFTTPTKLEQLLPDMACIAMNHGLWNPAEKFVDHNSFVLLRDTVQGLLNYMTPKRIHAQIKRAASDRIGDRDNLLGSAMLETALDEKIPEAVDHERIGLADNSLNDVESMLDCSYLQLLLEKNGRLLIVIADNLVHYVFPVTRDVLIKKTSIIERFMWCDVRLYGTRTGLKTCE